MLYFGLALIALIAGIVTSIAGGGGIFVVSFLLILDIPIKTIVGTNRVSALMDNATSAYCYHKSGKIKSEFFKYAIIPAVLGIIIGSKLLLIINGKALEKLIPIILLILVIQSYAKKKTGLNSEFKGFTKKSLILGILTTFIMAVYMGFFGIAVGSFYTLALVHLFKFDFLEAVATVKPILFFMGLISLIFYAMNGLIDYKIAFFITIFRMVGSRLGSTFASKKGAQFVKPVFLGLCILTILKEFFM